MLTPKDLPALDNLPDVADLMTKFLWEANYDHQYLSLTTQLLTDALQVLSGTSTQLLEIENGQWQQIALAGAAAKVPDSLAAEVLDTAQPRGNEQWLIAPLDQRGEAGQLLATQLPDTGTPELLAKADAVAKVLGHALGLFDQRQKERQRIERLEAILEIAGQWNQTSDMGSLLLQMAETSTRLIGADRASIFLWDKPNKLLVGRPALGVEGGELRIPDNQGIVGQVVKSGEPRRVDQGFDQNDINRDVDQQLEFQTETLLCVPLHGKSGQLFGAFEMINKLEGNFSQEDEDALVELATHAAIALENTQEYQQLLTSRQQMTDQAAQQVQLIGESAALQALRSTVTRVANTELAILILGENGTGKEVVAQLIHYLSSRRTEPLVAVNCAALTETLLESELFGHEKGAFTDAHEARAGKFELASGGTLFLDEVGDMSLGGQAKLLRVLEEKVVVRVGGSTPIHTDARVIAATNRDLAELVREKKFREDLYFRLNVVTLDLPALRDRGDDVMLLAEHFFGNFCQQAGRKRPKFSAAARKRLCNHPWPGNVRELRNLMERLAYLSSGDKIDADDLAFILAPDGRPDDIVSMDLPLTDATERFQASYIERHIDAARGNMSQAAKRLGLHRSNLYRKMRQLDMPTSK